MDHLLHLFDKRKDKKNGGSDADGKKHGKATPPAMPPKDELVSKLEDLSLANRPGKATPPAMPPKDELVSKLEDLSLANQPGKHPNAEFVGGFKRGPAHPDVGQTSFAAPSPPSFPMPSTHPVASTTPTPPGPLPRPPQMFFPTPEHYEPSRTMQYALSDPSDPAWLELEPTPPPHPSRPPKAPHLPARPHSSEPPRINNNLGVSPAHLEVPRPVSSPPISPKNSRTSSSGRTTPERKAGVKSAGDERTQCSGIAKKTGKRCARQVKADPPLNMVDPSLPVERFCHQHREDLLKKDKTGFYSRNTGDWVEFSEYIPEYLSPDTRAALRAEMAKRPSQSDEPGFIYAFEIRDPDTPFLFKLKVGRTVTLEGRLNEWQKQCGSKEQVLRGWWPGNIMEKDLETSLLKGRVQSGEKGKYCHKLERLVHLELAELVVRAPYLDKEFPNVSTHPVEDNSGTTTPNAPARNGKRGASSEALKSLQQGNKPCPDCGSMHKEIFPFSRPEVGPYRGQEWQKLAMPVIEKWGWFVETLA